MSSTSSPAPPTFAVVGAVNHGKSSVVSTLAEDDQVRVSSMPGETVEARRFWLLDLSIFIDTPGFQNALEALDELAPAESASTAEEKLAVFRQFLHRHAHGADFDAERRLLQPIVDGAGIVYVVDASEPLLDLHRAEMRILKLTGRPRLAIINRTGSDDHSAEWKAALDGSFHVVREFNAHTATFDDRIRLLRRLAGLAPEWERQLEQAVARYEADWRQRLVDASEIIVEMLADCLSHSEHQLLDEESDRESVEAALKTRFQAWIVGREARAHRQIVELFRHRLVQPDEAGHELFAEDLFSDRTWTAFGCNEHQLIALGAISGAALGVLGDLAVAGHSLGLFAAGGAAVGASSAFLIGRARPEFQIELPRQFRLFGPRLKMGGTTLRIPPYTAVNFPWILIDRALAVVHYTTHRAHARRDAARIDSAEEKRKLAGKGASTEHWPDALRREIQRHFVAMRVGKFGRDERVKLRDHLQARLEAVL